MALRPEIASLTALHSLGKNLALLNKLEAAKLVQFVP